MVDVLGHSDSPVFGCDSHLIGAYSRVDHHINEGVAQRVREHFDRSWFSSARIQPFPKLLRKIGVLLRVADLTVVEL